MVSTVSTRGVKFKFSVGERVLCYEPDPTKAKVLYESKVLELVVARDERGRKVPEYLIHFFGWNSSWDRCVREEFILPYTEENSELQFKLATEAALSIKGKRKIKLPPLIKETLAKKQCSEAEKQKNEKAENPEAPSSETSSEDESEKEVIINIPEVLKKELEEDNRNITKKNRFVKLPCKPNVIAILEAYVKHLAAKLLCVSPPKNSENGKQFLPEDVKNKLNLCKEAMDGLRVYFDFTLPYLLLYQQEKKQHFTTGMNSSPVSSVYKWEPKENIENVVKVEKLDNEVTLSSLKNINISPVKVELENALRTHSRGRKSTRSHSIKTNSPNKLENITNGEIERKPEISEKATKKIEKIKKTPKEKPKFTPTRVLRSTEKLKSQPQKEDAIPKSPSSPPPPPVLNDNKRVRSASPNPVLPLENLNPPRLTRKSRQKSLSPTNFSNPTIPTLSSQNLSEDKVIPTPSTSCAKANPVKASSSFPLSSNCISSSNSSSHSTSSNPNISHQLHLAKNEALLQETLSWRLLPQHLYDCIPASPSLIYGAQHLLRLFVKLPELLSKTKMSKKKMTILLDILESFLIFMVEKKNELFLPSAYYESYDEELDRSI